MPQDWNGSRAARLETLMMNVCGRGGAGGIPMPPAAAPAWPFSSACRRSARGAPNLRANAAVMYMADVTFRSISVCISLMDSISWMQPKPPMVPALLTRMMRSGAKPLSLSTACFAHASVSSRFRRSTAATLTAMLWSMGISMPSVLERSRSSMAAVSCSDSELRATSINVSWHTHSRAMATATARPKPRLAPVMTTAVCGPIFPGPSLGPNPKSSSPSQKKKKKKKKKPKPKPKP
mmetsp:Transcript_35053/g.110288  ORF Transcript_35053/g.110288 Transcript_35053/m.110288 type:complete len:236 (-) Transcript_35053:27-734(-)